MVLMLPQYGIQYKLLISISASQPTMRNMHESSMSESATTVTTSGCLPVRNVYVPVLLFYLSVFMTL